MKSAQITIPGIPVALARPRFAANHVYDPQKHTKTRLMIYLQQYEGEKLEGPLLLTTLFFMPIPKTIGKAKTQELKGKLHYCRPDSDNLLKWLGDMCQASGNIFNDDAQIAGGVYFKVYDEAANARTVFTLTELGNKKVKNIDTINFAELLINALYQDSK